MVDSFANAKWALTARSTVPGAAEVPRSLFLNYVLPYRQLDEPIDDWREGFYTSLKSHVMDARNLKEVAEAVIPKAWSVLRASTAVMGAKANNTPVEFAANNTP